MIEITKRQPKVRFKEFAGEKAKAWEQRKLSDIATISTGKAFSSEDFVENGDFLVVTNKNIQDEINGIESTGDRININDESLLKKYRLNGNNILVTMDGVNIGKVGRFSCDTAVLAQRVGRLNSEEIEFVYSVVTNPRFVAEMNKLSVGNAIKHISLKQISEYSTYAPIDTLEQNKIGKFFSSIDNLIALHQRELDNTKTLKQTMLSKMFPKDRSNVPEIRFAGFTDPWEQRKLGEIVDIRSGRDYKHLSEGNIPVYGTGGYMLSVNEALSYNEDAIGIGRKGTIDKPYLLRAPFWTVDTLFYAVPENDMDLDFAHGIFQKTNWKQKDESTGVPSLSKMVIKNVGVSVPGHDEQKKIGCFFSSLDNLITLYQRELETYQKLKKTMLDKMFV